MKICSVKEGYSILTTNDIIEFEKGETTRVGMITKMIPSSDINSNEVRLKVALMSELQGDTYEPIEGTDTTSSSKVIKSYIGESEMIKDSPIRVYKWLDEAEMSYNDVMAQSAQQNPESSKQDDFSPGDHVDFPIPVVKQPIGGKNQLSHTRDFQFLSNYTKTISSILQMYGMKDIESIIGKENLENLIRIAVSVKTS